MIFEQIHILLPQFLTMSHSSSLTVLKTIYDIDPTVLESGAMALYKQNPTSLTSILDMLQALKSDVRVKKCIFFQSFENLRKSIYSIVSLIYIVL